jgi:predicted NBD/HSP70 family sugar kinase
MDRLDREHLVTRIADLLADVTRRLEAEHEQRVLGAGVSVGGHVHEGVVQLSPGLGWGRHPAWSEAGHGFRLQQYLEHRLDFPVIVDNDITALTAQILFNELVPSSFAVVSVLGEGIGGGLVQHGRIWRGAHGLAIEPGHLTIDYGPDARLCRCGNRGCLEAYTTPLRVLERMHEAVQAGSSFPLVSMRMAGLRPLDDKLVADIFDEAGGAMGRGLANIVNAVDPATILVFAQPEFLEPAEASAASTWRNSLERDFEQGAFSTGGQTDLIYRSMPLTELEDLGSQGAACLMVERLLDELGANAGDRPLLSGKRILDSPHLSRTFTLSTG